MKKLCLLFSVNEKRVAMKRGQKLIKTEKRKKNGLNFVEQMKQVNNNVYGSCSCYGNDWTSERYESKFTRGLKEWQMMILLKCYRRWELQMLPQFANKMLRLKRDHSVSSECARLRWFNYEMFEPPRQRWKFMHQINYLNDQIPLSA